MTLLPTYYCNLSHVYCHNYDTNKLSTSLAPFVQNGNENKLHAGSADLYTIHVDINMIIYSFFVKTKR